MLTTDQIEALGDKAQMVISPVVEFLMQDIAKRISAAGQMTSTAAYETWRLQQLGVSQRQLKKELRKRLRVSHRELRRLLEQSAEAGYDYDIRKHPYVHAAPFKENQVLQQIVEAAVQLADDDLSNITQTMGFVGPDGRVRELTQAFVNACDFAFTKVSTGAQDYSTAIREATRGLSEKGIVSIDYESGRHVSLEAAVRRNVMSGLGLMQEQISKQNHDDFGCDGWEVSAHAASAPDHEPIQGKQYSDEAYEKLNNSLVRRIGTLNCGHAAFPIILGVDSPQYSPEELLKMRQENEKGIDYNGKHYTMYEATQRQRKLERAIRKQKRRILVDESTGDKEKLQRDQIKYQVLDQEYRRFSKAAGLRMQHERMEMVGFGSKHAIEAEKTAESLNVSKIEIENSGDRGIINTRGLAMSLRKPKSYILTDEEIQSVRFDAKEIGIDESMLRFNKGYQTGFSDERVCINIRGDILPDPDGISARDRMSQRAVLAHEYYGHFMNHPSEYEIGDWRDEFRASYDAAVKTPNLSDIERRDLMIDAYDRAKEAGAFNGYDETARRIIYGF